MQFLWKASKNSSQFQNISSAKENWKSFAVKPSPLFNGRHFVYPNVTLLSLLFIILFFFLNLSMSRRVKEGRRIYWQMFTFFKLVCLCLFNPIWRFGNLFYMFFADFMWIYLPDFQLPQSGMTYVFPPLLRRFPQVSLKPCS